MATEEAAQVSVPGATILDRVRILSQRARDAGETADVAREARDAALIEAMDEGLTWVQVADASQLSRTRIQRIVAGYED